MTSPTRRSILAALAATAVAPGLARGEDRPAEPVYRAASDLVQDLAGRRVSSRELVDAAIARIEALDGRFNAVVVRDFQRARDAADAADAELARGERKPLLGLPMTVKEQFNVAGLPTSWGYKRFADWRPAEDALAVQRLKAAGAIILGKTNVPEGLSDWQSYNDVYGTTRNPWDPARTPGGSSGGAATALAAGYVALELGSDIGGSLRAPAHYCGVFAHKPSLELIPQRGSGYPDSPSIPTQGDMAVAGPMARHAADLDRALSVLAGPDPLWDGIGYRLDLPPPVHGRLADYRVLVIDTHPLCPTASSVSGALNGLADRLGTLGCSVARTHPALPDLATTTRVYSEMLHASFATSLTANQRAMAHAVEEGLSPENRTLDATRIRGLVIAHPAWLQLSYVRSGLRARWQALLQSVDVILCPPMPTVAFPHDHMPFLDRKLDIDGRRVSYDDQIAWSAVATLCGLPATVAPIARSEAGLPIGVQIIGGYLRDRTTIAFAGLIEQAFGGFVPPPGLS